MRLKARWCLLVLLSLGFSGCTKSVDLEAERAALRAAEQEAVSIANARDAQRWLALYEEGATIVPPNGPVLNERKAIADWVGRATSNAKLHFEYTPLRTEVSAGGDLGYTLSHYELTLAAPDGSTTVERGRWLIAWRKQPGGRWKTITEIWNLDPPPTRPQNEGGTP
jgi:ketosteroid isomerase-like protein